MAPEVVRCVNYGYSADVYSFSILFWQLFSLKTPFEHWDSGKHFDHVVMSGKRPHKLNHDHLPSKMLHQMMEDAWSEDRTKRPTFHQICQFLQAELMDASIAAGSNNSAIGDRSVYLMNRSYASLLHNSERDYTATEYKEHHC
jgi:Protein tyrosine and serine/threonine kinase